MDIYERLYELGREFCDDYVENEPIEKLWPEGGFTYIHGVLFWGILKYYQITKDKRYFDYLKKWTDARVDSDGNITMDREAGDTWSLKSLDFRQASTLFFDLYKMTGEEKYKKAIIPMVESIKEYPKTSKNMLWHMMWTENQVWLDGLYMASPLMCMYADMFDKPEWFDFAAHQAITMYENIRDDNGLLRHGWDDTKKAGWADKETGLCEVVWSRSCGWVVVAICDMLDYIPKTHQKRDELIRILNSLLEDIVRYQDKSGLWYQVMDKGDRADNWLESSATGLFVYAMAKGIRKGYLDRKYIKNIESASEGLIRDCISHNEEGRIVLSKICAGFCIADTYEKYVKNAQVIDNDSHGTGLFIQMCSEVHRLREYLDK